MENEAMVDKVIHKTFDQEVRKFPHKVPINMFLPDRLVTT
jgi:hypothetical protein